MPRGFYTYESFFADASLLTVFGVSAGSTFSTAYQISVPGRIVGLRCAVNASADNKGVIMYLLESTVAGAVSRVECVSTDFRSANVSLPGFRNVYLRKLVRIDTAKKYRVCIFGSGINNGIWKGALSAGAVTHGHITALQNNVPTGQFNSAAATSARFPNAAPASGAGDMYGLDVLFLAD